MRDVVLAMFVSVDGYVEGPNKQLVGPPYSPDLQKHWIDRNMERAGLMMYGRVAYEGMARYWSSAQAHQGQAARLAEMDKLVFSRTLQKADWGRATIIRDDIAAEVNKRKLESGKDMVLIAGAGIAQTFLRLNLIDELSLLVFPALLGSGTRLFAGDYPPAQPKLAQAPPFDSGAIRLTYRRADVAQP